MFCVESQLRISSYTAGSSFFQMAFSYLGTTDVSAYLAMADALAFRQSQNETAITAYMHSLAVAGGQLLARAWGTETLVDDSMIAAMVNVRLPTGNIYFSHGILASVTKRDLL